MEIYETKDLVTASILIYFNCKIIKMRCVGTSTYFSFEATPQLRKVLELNLLGQLLVEPKKYHDVEKNTRGKAYELLNIQKRVGNENNQVQGQR